MTIKSNVSQVLGLNSKVIDLKFLRELSISGLKLVLFKSGRFASYDETQRQEPKSVTTLTVLTTFTTTLTTFTTMYC